MAPSGESPLLQAMYDVRRHIVLAIVVGLIVAILGYVALGSISSDWQARATIDIVDQNTTPVLLDLDPPFPTRTAGSVAAALQDFVKADGLNDFQALPSDQNRQVEVTLDGSNPAIADKLDGEIDRFVASQLQILTDQIDSAVDAAQGRLADLEKESTAVADLATSNPNDDVIRVRQLDVEHSLSDARTRLTDLTTIRSNTQGDLRRAEKARAVEPGAGSASRILAPAILGLLVGLGAAVAAGRLDSRLRTAARIAAASGGLRLLGVVSPMTEGADDGLHALTLALKHVVSNSGSQVVLVPLSSRTIADNISASIGTDLARVTEPIAASSEGVSAGAGGHPVVLVIDSQVDRPRNLKQAMQLMSAVGINAEGVVLHVESSTERLRALVDNGNG